MYRAQVNRFLTCFLLLIIFFMIACNRPPAGLEAFKMSQTAAMALDHFNIELARKTEMGDFKNIQAIDCLSSYFYDHDITDLSPKGIESGVTQLQGRPRAHQESETLFTDGKTYFRNTSSWENPTFGSDDAHPDWFVASMSKDPKETCTSMKRGEEFGYVSYDKILRVNDVHYVGRQSVNNHECFEYQASFPGQKYSDTMTTTQAGTGSYSYREMVNTTIHSKVCFGIKDHLPYRVIGDDYTATYDYAAPEKMAAPSAP